jgi:hypothetical protein
MQLLRSYLLVKVVVETIEVIETASYATHLVVH